VRQFALLLFTATLCGCPDGSPPPPSPPACVLVGTPVTTASGPLAIEALAVGDVLICQGDDGQRVPGRVTAVRHAEREGYLRLTIDGRELAVTAEHPLATPAGWVEAGALRPGDLVLTEDGERALESIEPVVEPCRVVDLSVTPHPTFFAGGVLVHNKAPIPDPEEEERERTEARFVDLDTEPSADGWSSYPLAPTLTPEEAATLSPRPTRSPEAAVTAFFASRMRGDEAFRGALVAEPDAALTAALAWYETVTFHEVTLQRTKSRGESPDRVWVEVSWRIELPLEESAGEQPDPLRVGVDRTGVGWRITSLPH